MVENFKIDERNSECKLINMDQKNTDINEKRVTIEEIQELYQKLQIDYSKQPEFRSFEDHVKELMVKKTPLVPHFILNSRTSIS